MEITVECRKRPEGSKPRALRRSGLIPAVLYGHKGTESISLAIDAKKVTNLLKDATINNTLIKVNIPEMSWQGRTLLREVQAHPYKGHPYHLSFFAIAAQDSVEVVVPITFTGDAPGDKQEGGILETGMTEIVVQCAPNRIPEEIQISLESLHLNDSLHVREIVFPEGVEPVSDPEQVVAAVMPPRMPSVTEEEGEEGEVEVEGEEDVEVETTEI
jgi:large subunit ribosomal protein L25